MDRSTTNGPTSHDGGEPRIDYRDERTRQQMGRALAGNFPATRDELVDRAIRRAALMWVIDELSRLAVDEQFENMEAVWQALEAPEERP